jgi:hypothetical protein
VATAFWAAADDEVASWQKISSTELHACFLLSRFNFAVNAPLPLRYLSSQMLHLKGIIYVVVLAK